jgi:hypothetical protein
VTATDQDGQITALPPHIALGASADQRTVNDVRARLAAIGRDDPEHAHHIVDDLMTCALQLIADGHPRPAALARDTLRVCDADFPRWCA